MDEKQENLLSSSLPSRLLSIDEELWKMAEERVQEILWTIQPNVLSEVNRKNIINYVQRLIGDYYGAQVFPFGSFPLKTYLPDGDIDMTTLIHGDEEEDLAQTICTILKSADDPEYQVKYIQYIRAEVQVVKCTVKNIPVDISFNQMGGLHTLFFLDHVDQLVGKNHIFKRSIILIKSWCYNESRIHGAYHGLLSTYATEILVLYIINRFHSSIRGPLEVLYIFLDYFSSFDWEHNYISIWGPKTLSSLPKIVDTLECDQGEFLLHKEFLKNYKDMYLSKAKESGSTMAHEFHIKGMNILDPLRNHNNLGRSIHKGNFSRIKLALSLGAERLKQILILEGENMGEALEKFFFWTLERNGKGQRVDVDVPISPFGTGRCEESVLNEDYDNYYGGSQYVQQYPNYVVPETNVHSNYPSSSFHQNHIHAPLTQQKWSMFYQSGTGVYNPRQSLFYPTYSLEEGGRSRGTGTYIPDMSYNFSWDIHAKENKSRRFPYAKHNAMLELSLKSQQAKEVHSKTKSFELSNEDFPLLPSVRKVTSPPQTQEGSLEE